MTTWEGFDLAPAHRRWRFWIAQGRDDLPGARTSADLIPFRRGRLHQPATADVRRLELRGYITETDLAGLLATRDEIKRLLEPERDDPGILTDTFEDGSIRWIRAIPRSADATYAGQAKRLYSILLEALDPFWYGAWGSLALDVGADLDDGYVLDGSADLVVVPTSPAHVVEIDAFANAEIERVRVTFTGPSVSGPGVELVRPGASAIGFQMATALAAGEVLVVDNWARTAAIGTVPRRADMALRDGNRHGEYVHLLPRANTIRITGQPAEARLQFTPTFE